MRVCVCQCCEQIIYERAFAELEKDLATQRAEVEKNTQVRKLPSFIVSESTVEVRASIRSSS